MFGHMAKHAPASDRRRATHPIQTVQLPDLFPVRLPEHEYECNVKTVFIYETGQIGLHIRQHGPNTRLVLKPLEAVQFVHIPMGSKRTKQIMGISKCAELISAYANWLAVQVCFHFFPSHHFHLSTHLL